MDPLAYGFRDHEIFGHPNKIQLDAKIRLPTPAAFTEELTEKEIEVLPLVDDYKKTWRAGWCTYSNYFDKNPDVEFFCGGVNHKTPTAAGLWRQGNFLHFGFEQSPQEMNRHGKELLLNSIAYISRFSQDRPIATTPSVFGGEVAKPRRTPGAWLKYEDRAAWVLDIFQPDARAHLQSLKTTTAKKEWCDENSKYFAPGQDCLLGTLIDGSRVTQLTCSASGTAKRATNCRERPRVMSTKKSSSLRRKTTESLNPNVSSGIPVSVCVKGFSSA